jgi:hypothetical protein
MVVCDLGSGEAFRQLTESGADRWSREVGVAGTRHPAGGTRLGAWGAAAVTGAAAALLAACSSATPQQLHIPVTATANAPAGNSHTVSMTVGGRTRASLDVLSGTTVLTIGTANFGPGGPLLTVTTPGGTPVPQLSSSNPDGTANGNGPLVDLTAPNSPAVTVTLNAGVSWQIDLDGGASRTDVDLTGGELSGISFNAGSSLVTLALPKPRGNVPVQMVGGASDFQLSLPNGIPAQVTAGGGASEVSLEGQQHTGVAGGSVFTTAGWAPGVTGFNIDATAGVSTITVTARPS